MKQSETDETKPFLFAIYGTFFLNTENQNESMCKLLQIIIIRVWQHGSQYDQHTNVTVYSLATNRKHIFLKTPFIIAKNTTKVLRNTYNKRCARYTW